MKSELHQGHLRGNWAAKESYLGVQPLPHNANADLSPYEESRNEPEVSKKGSEAYSEVNEIQSETKAP
jgi:hypothetical protein